MKRKNKGGDDTPESNILTFVMNISEKMKPYSKADDEGEETEDEDEEEEDIRKR